MEKIVHNGIPITIEPVNPISNLTKTKFVVKGPNKEWEFEVVQLAFLKAQGILQNRYENSRALPGETTALAEVGMQQLELFARRTRLDFTYIFDTEHPTLIKWYKKYGKKALGINAGDKKDNYFVEAKRVFSKSRLRRGILRTKNMFNL